MYSALKKVLLGILPAKLSAHIEFQLRWLYSLFYRGFAVECPVCGGTFSGFIPLTGGDLICPRCGCLPRHRRLWIMLLQGGLLRKGLKLLHFSPSRILQRKLSTLIGEGYESTDYDQAAFTGRHYDITDLPLPDNSVEMIICFHVLEHIRDDKKAIRELCRILMPKGRALIQTPFDPLAMVEDENIVSPADRLLRFGQEDHVRVYSVEGLSRRLQDAGFLVEVNRFDADSRRGMKKEIIFTCFKN